MDAPRGNVGNWEIHSDPPPYREADLAHSPIRFRQDESLYLSIPRPVILRKPLQTQADSKDQRGTEQPESNQNMTKSRQMEDEQLEKENLEARPNIPPWPELSLRSSTPVLSNMYLSPGAANSSASRTGSSPTLNVRPSTATSSVYPESLPTSTKSSGSYVQKAFREVCHFAGGSFAIHLKARNTSAS
ncbi:hypothetical protein G7Y89_g13677 [Cudoniella acicularis]|uniref:Uncharacterized protein n=1 Tax=Cudoniella acicularis TaxID=354080 RepID=A0A8H4R834_9HELO|nr:hypothetical protein G7Y89_g13677 [Cudoniella acicularis]